MEQSRIEVFSISLEVNFSNILKMDRVGAKRKGSWSWVSIAASKIAKII